MTALEVLESRIKHLEAELAEAKAERARLRVPSPPKTLGDLSGVLEHAGDFSEEEIDMVVYRTDEEPPLRMTVNSSWQPGPQPEGARIVATPEDPLTMRRRRQTLLLLGMLTFLVGMVTWQISVGRRRAWLNDRLAEAVARNDLAAARELLRQGADAGAKPADLRVMWHSVRPEFLYNPLRWPLLAEEYRFGRFEALPVLCGAQDGEMAQLLIAYGADPNAAGHLGITALTLAAEYGNARVVKVLLASGAQPNHRTRLGNTALLAAAEALSWPPLPRNPADHHYVAVMQALLEAGADVNARSSMGRTALTLVKRSGRTRYPYAELLRKAGAKE